MKDTDAVTKIVNALLDRDEEYINDMSPERLEAVAILPRRARLVALKRAKARHTQLKKAIANGREPKPLARPFGIPGAGCRATPVRSPEDKPRIILASR